MTTSQIRQRTAALILIIALIAIAIFGQDLYMPAFTWLWTNTIAPVVDAIGQFFAWLTAVL